MLKTEFSFLESVIISQCFDGNFFGAFIDAFDSIVDCIIVEIDVSIHSSDVRVLKLLVLFKSNSFKSIHKEGKVFFMPSEHFLIFLDLFFSKGWSGGRKVSEHDR